MKTRLMVATAAFALFAGSAVAQMSMTPDQQKQFMTRADAAGGEVIPDADAEGWKVGATVPDDYESTSMDDMDGMKGYSYYQTDSSYYVVDQDKKIVSMMDKTGASSAGGEVTLGPDGKPESQPKK